MSAPASSPAPTPAPAGGGNDRNGQGSDLVQYTHWIYGLHTLAVAMGVFGGHSVARQFAFGAPSLIAVIMNYSRRTAVTGTWLESHFHWQIRTFWFAWLWIAVVTMVSAPFVLIWVGLWMLDICFALIGLWIIYRVIRGWSALRDGRSMPGGLAW